jgi:hypothetical protein
MLELNDLTYHSKVLRMVNTNEKIQPKKIEGKENKKREDSIDENIIDEEIKEGEEYIEEPSIKKNRGDIIKS